MNGKQIGLLIATCVISLNVCGCSKEARVENWIKAIIRTGESEKAEVLSDPEIKSFKVYRDGDNTGVCYEYVVTFPVTSSSELKRNLISGVKTICITNKETGTAMKSGIYFRFIYKSESGKILADQKITAADLKL